MSWENWAPRRNVLGELGLLGETSWENCPGRNVPRRYILPGGVFWEEYLRRNVEESPPEKSILGKIF
jgi:hypothetical protein